LLLAAIALAVLISPFFTALTNLEPVIAGPLAIAGLSLYDGLSLSINLAIALIPFFLGMRLLSGRDDHRFLLRLLAISGVLYAFPVLFEFRMSPRLHIWTYGFFQHNWVQHIRGGGFRPIVFLEHGLAVGLFLATAALAAAGQVRAAARDGRSKGPWIVANILIVFALLLSRNLAAVALVMVFLPAVLFLRVRNQMFLAAMVAVIFLMFPFLRGAGVVPTEMVTNVAAAINEPRAASMRFRFKHEDDLLDRAQQKLLFGWGGWGRNRLYDPETGRELSVTDGGWIIVIGTYGWVGYVAQFGLMAVPLLTLWRGQRKRPGTIDPATAALAMVMALSLIYLIPNDFRNPIFWLIAGALAGACLSMAGKRSPSDHASSSGRPVTLARSGAHRRHS
jgi:hypothetical protein